MDRSRQGAFDERINDTAWVTSEIARGVRRAMAENKLKNNPIAVWRDGQVKIVAPEDIPDEACDFEGFEAIAGSSPSAD